MIHPEKCMQTDLPPIKARNCCCAPLGGVTKLISSLLLPLMLGIFTIVITLQQDKVARLQRNEDRNIAELQRELERKLANERYQNDIFDEYVKEIGTLLKESNGSLTSNSVAATVARAKSLNIFRRLDPQHNLRIIRFLHEAGQLTQTNEQSSLDLSTAELRDMDFSYSAINQENVHKLSLAGTVLSGSIFANIEMKEMNFSATQLDDTKFSVARLDNVNFAFAQLGNTNFSAANLDNVNFSSAQLGNVTFQSAQLADVNFLASRLDNVNFTFTQLVNANFSSAKLNNVNFSSAILILASFSGAYMSRTDFRRTVCAEARFDRADLSWSTFRHANAKNAFFNGADLTNVDFYLANLDNADFTDTKITDSQLRSALSIRNARLSNGTLARDTNLIKNGQADFSVALIDHWTLKTGNINTVQSDESRNDCHFALQSNDIGATMLQRINLSDIWDYDSWPRSRAVLNASMSVGVSIRLSGINSIEQVSDSQILNSTEKNIILNLGNDMRELEVLIEFSTLTNRKNSKYTWCDDIELFIIYGTKFEVLRPHANIPENATWAQNGITIAGGHGSGEALEQLSFPFGLYVDDDQSVLVADQANNRIVQWKRGATNGEVVAGGNGWGAATNHLNYTVAVIVDKETDSLIVCDRHNIRVMRWSRQNRTNGEILFDTVSCFGLTMDDKRSLYVVDVRGGTVREYRVGEKSFTVVAGGNGWGFHVDQLDSPTNIFVDRDYSIYVSDLKNHRVMKWVKGAKAGIVVAGDQKSGSGLTHLDRPMGLFVDLLGTVYVADGGNNRIVRWFKGATQGNIIAGGNGQGAQANQLDSPRDISFDKYGNLYVVDEKNHRVQRFLIKTY